MGGVLYQRISSSGGKVKEFSLDWTWEESFTDALFNLEYIGSVECIMVLFDSIVRYSGEIERNMESRIKNMVAFLECAGMKVPGGDNKAELDKWWRENRANVERVLREKADRLPRLPITPIILGDREEHLDYITASSQEF
jgi:hypothetical protein